jgi:hypothetical protein
MFWDGLFDLPEVGGEESVEGERREARICTATESV